MLHALFLYNMIPLITVSFFILCSCSTCFSHYCNECSAFSSVCLCGTCSIPCYYHRSLPRIHICSYLVIQYNVAISNQTVAFHGQSCMCLTHRLVGVVVYEANSYLQNFRCGSDGTTATFSAYLVSLVAHIASYYTAWSKG